MTIAITSLMHNTIADSVYSSIVSKSSKFYYFLGKTVPYTILNGVEHIETPLSTYKYALSTRKDIISVKEIASNDVSFVVPRINWQASSIYDTYDDSYAIDNLSYSGASSINTARFYVLTDEYNLYLCLDNNLNSLSTVKPTGYNDLPFITSDGYKWKFAMNIPLSLRVKFLNNLYIPITTAINSSFYNNGAIDTVSIVNTGTGYPSNTTASITISSGTTAMGSLVVGRQYVINTLGTTTNTQWNTIAGTTGITYIVGSAIIPTIVGTGLGTGNVKGVGAVLSPRISTVNGEITTVDIISGGTGYATATLTVVGTGTGQFTGNATAIITPVIVNGVITHVILNDPGINYNVNNTTIVVQSDTGVEAQLSAIVAAGQITGVIIDNAGHSYRSATATAYGNTISDTPAQIVISTSGGNIDTVQANIELLAVSGAIDYIHVSDQGNGYTAANINITGDGEGATATAEIVNNKLHKITITNRGFGYTYATVNITALITTPTELASARAIIPPHKGHGKHILHELHADTLMFYSTITGTNVSGFSFNNDYRQFGIIKNIQEYDSELTYSNALGSACFVVQGILSNGTVTDDMILTDEFGDTYTVISSTIVLGTDIKILLQPNSNSTPVSGNVLSNNTTSFIVHTAANPTIDKYSGDMLYIDNRAAFYQTNDQTVTLQNVLKF